MQAKEREKISFLSELKTFDIFGESVKLTYQKRATFQTWVGTFFSLIVLTMFLAFFGVRTGKLVSATDPFFSMMTMAKEEIDPIDLWALNFIFAIEDIDPRAGHIIVEHTL